MSLSQTPLNASHRALGAKGVQVPALVQKRALRQVKVQMARRGGQVHRFQRPAGFLLDDVQALAEPQEILHVLQLLSETVSDMVIWTWSRRAMA